MGKIVNAEKDLKKAADKKCSCYVLITCTEPGLDGNMQVEMNYEGDEGLAAFLVDNASQIFEERFKDCRESQ